MIIWSNLVHLSREKQIRGNETPTEGPLQMCETKLAGAVLEHGRRTKGSRSVRLELKFPQNPQ